MQIDLPERDSVSICIHHLPRSRLIVRPESFEFTKRESEVDQRYITSAATIEPTAMPPESAAVGGNQWSFGRHLSSRLLCDVPRLITHGDVHLHTTGNAICVVAGNGTITVTELEHAQQAGCTLELESEGLLRRADVSREATRTRANDTSGIIDFSRAFGGGLGRLPAGHLKLSLRIRAWDPRRLQTYLFLSTQPRDPGTPTRGDSGPRIIRWEWDSDTNLGGHRLHSRRLEQPQPSSGYTCIR